MVGDARGRDAGAVAHGMGRGRRAAAAHTPRRGDARNRGGRTVPGGFSTVYAVLKAMEEAGRVRRGYFVAGLGGAQFASAGALDQLRAHRDAEEPPRVVIVAATDPANPVRRAS